MSVSPQHFLPAIKQLKSIPYSDQHFLSHMQQMPIQLQHQHIIDISIMYNNTYIILSYNNNNNNKLMLIHYNEHGMRLKSMVLSNVNNISINQFYKYPCNHQDSTYNRQHIFVSDHQLLFGSYQDKCIIVWNLHNYKLTQIQHKFKTIIGSKYKILYFGDNKIICVVQYAFLAQKFIKFTYYALPFDKYSYPIHQYQINDQFQFTNNNNKHSKLIIQAADNKSMIVWYYANIGKNVIFSSYQIMKMENQVIWRGEIKQYQIKIIKCVNNPQCQIQNQVQGIYHIDQNKFMVIVTQNRHQLNNFSFIIYESQRGNKDIKDSNQSNNENSINTDNISKAPLKYMIGNKNSNSLARRANFQLKQSISKISTHHLKLIKCFLMGNFTVLQTYSSYTINKKMFPLRQYYFIDNLSQKISARTQIQEQENTKYIYSFNGHYCDAVTLYKQMKECSLIKYHQIKFKFPWSIMTTRFILQAIRDCNEDLLRETLMLIYSQKEMLENGDYSQL